MSVFAGRRPVGAAKTPEGHDKALNVSENGFSPRSFQGHRMNELVLEGEIMNLLRD